MPGLPASHELVETVDTLYARLIGDAEPFHSDCLASVWGLREAYLRGAAGLGNYGRTSRLSTIPVWKSVSDCWRISSGG